MPRSTSRLLAGAAALTLVANVAAQTPPSFSGRWVVVSRAAADAIDRTNSPVDTGDVIIIEQTDRTLTFAKSGVPTDPKVTYAIEESKGTASVKARGPTSVIFKGVEVEIDTTGVPRLRAQWGSGSIVLDINSIASTAELNMGTMTLSLDPAGTLLVQVDIPAVGNQPARRAVSYLRRA